MVSLLTGIAACISLCLVISKLLRHSRQARGKPLPWTGKGGIVFAELWANIATAWNFKWLMESTYKQFAKKGYACRVPNLQGSWIQFPPSLLTYLTSTQDHIFNALASHEHSFQMEYTIPDAFQEAYLPVDIIRKYLPRKLPSLTADIMEELTESADEQWGTNTENWNIVSVYETCMNIIARTSNRLLVGDSVCRNPDYIARCSAYSGHLFLTAALIRCFPSSIRPVFGPIIALPIQRIQQKIWKHVNPVVEQRLGDLRKIEQDPEFAKEYSMPNDFLQWDMLHTSNLNRPDLQTTRSFGSRILMMNIIMLHTSTHTLLNALLDILSHPDAGTLVSELRQEAHDAIVASETPWTRDTISNSLPKLDSALRESMRLHPLISRGITRTVVAKEGVILPESDSHIPYGKEISMNVHCIQRDPDNFENPNTYDPYRFFRHNEQLQSQESNKVTMGPFTEASLVQPLVMVSPTPSFLSFGYGRHACPGRFLAAQEIKIFLAYVLLNYEFLPINGPRLDNLWYGDIVMPPMDAKISVKRRKLDESMMMPKPTMTGEGRAQVA
ncbi:cytochrome P450 [Mariannaea sp. PMI_226]|nr:cytochrome P450 [Mariannaea sp. PMI_226]